MNDSTAPQSPGTAAPAESSKPPVTYMSVPYPAPKDAVTLVPTPAKGDDEVMSTPAPTPAAATK
jgi:hypothetical protein